MTLVSTQPAYIEAHTENEIATPGRRRSRGLPAWPIGWAIVAAMAALIIRTSLHSGLQTDAFWQVAAGNWMLDHHSVIRADVFSYSVPGRPWFAEEWGFEVALAFLVRHLGSMSYFLVSGLPCVGALVVSTLRWRRLRAHHLWVATLAVAVGFGLLIGLEPRPQDASYFYFATELYLLTVARRRPIALAALPVLFLVWANVHGSFLFGLGALALESILSGASAVRSRTTPWPTAVSRATSSRVSVSAPLPLGYAATSLVACAMAALVNPHGWHLYPYVIKVTTSGPLGALIEEWQSPNFHDIGPILGIALPLVIALIGMAVRRARVELFDLIIWVVLLAATLHAIRFAPYLAIAFGGLVAPWWQQQAWESAGATRATLPAAAVMSALLIGGGSVQLGLPVDSGSSAVPVAATSWLNGKTGRVFSTYAWNDYLIARGIPVFVDGRTDLYFGTGILNTYVQVSSLTLDPDRVFAKWHVRYVMWPRNTALTTYLSSDPKWSLAYRAGPADVFELARPTT